MASGLKDIDIRPRYISGADNILDDFLIPCLSVSSSYDRAAGYFSSAVLSLSWRGLRQLHGNGGSMRVVCSPALTTEDRVALLGADTAKCDASQEDALLEEFREMLASESLRAPAQALAAMVVSGFLDIRIAVPAGSTQNYAVRRLFHQKTGIFRDHRGGVVAFTGSMNETWMGLSPFGNHESIQAFCNWLGEREEARVFLEGQDFEDLWANRFPGVAVHTISQAFHDLLLDVSSHVDLPAAIESLTDEESRFLEKQQVPYRLRAHQEEVLKDWAAAGWRGIVKHATGSGKTLTAIHAIRVSSSDTNAVLVIVPSELLLRQWEVELERFAPKGTSVLLCGAGNVGWKRPGQIEAWTAASAQLKIVVAVLATASKAEFVSRVSQGEHVLLVADEVHRLGANEAETVLGLSVGRCLGLSATPERAGDPKGTKRIDDFFGAILSPQYGISDAIRDGVLTPYYYAPVVVELTSDEQEEWNRLSEKLAQLLARAESDSSLSSSVKRLLIQRARIAKQAEGKTSVAVATVLKEFEEGHRWLVYCDTVDQMNEICSMLRSSGADARVYYSSMEGDKVATLRYFEAVGGVVVSIRCLDEGIDIPAASHALIVASSRNPREFIQRRGRVLRRSPGKALANIHDVLVAPNSSVFAHGKQSLGPLVGELARGVEFARHAMNRHAEDHLHSIAIRYGLGAEDLQAVGFELEGDAEEETFDAAG